MKKFFKWTGIVLGSFLIMLFLAYLIINYKVKSRFNKEYQVSMQSISIPTDDASIKLGKHIATIKGCSDCHGKDFGGQVVIDDPGIGFLAGPNITRGNGGLLTRHKIYTDEDYIRAIKHGIGQDNKTLKLMPAYEYNPLSKKDLGALIAYLKSVPPVDNETAPIRLNPLAYVLTHFDKLPLVAAEKVDHRVQSKDEVLPEISSAYGQYVAVSCTGCHRENFKGGDAIVPGSPAVPDISSSGNLRKWSEAQFIQTLRTGITPEGKKLDAKYMPWKMTKEYTDIEIKSLYKFLKGLPG